MKRIDVGYLETILKELKSRISIFDVGLYLKMPVKEVRNQINCLKANFEVSEGQRVYVGLRG